MENFDLAVKNIHELANTDTQIIISLDAHRSNWWQKIFAFIPGDVLHPQQYTLETYKKLFESNGLQVVFQKQLGKEAMFDYWALGLKKMELFTQK